MFGPPPAAALDQTPPGASLSGFRSMEVLGSAPIWVLSGLRLERTGARIVAPGWAVGVYRTEEDGEREIVPAPGTRKRKSRRR